MVLHALSTIQVNGINVTQLPARDAYAYGRAILEIMFTKTELSRSVIVSSIKSKKTPLDKDKVQLIFGKLCIFCC